MAKPKEADRRVAATARAHSLDAPSGAWTVTPIVTQRTCAQLGIPPDRFKTIVREWRLPHVRSGQLIIVRTAVLLDALERHEVTFEDEPANDVERLEREIDADYRARGLRRRGAV